MSQTFVEKHNYEKEPLLRFTVVLFSGKLIVSGVHGALAR